MPLTLESTIVIDGSVAFTEVQGELTLLDPRSSVYYGLNRVGTFVWRAIATPLSLREVVKRVVERFEVSAEQAEKDVLALAEDLRHRGLIRVA